MPNLIQNVPDTGDQTEIRDELLRIFQSPQFARSPVMRGLLSFLVERTLAGEGETLKAYTIAVDALGRSEDFDARKNSYPRVQVGRLRKLLDEYYRTSESDPDLRLKIPKGSYAVHIEQAVDVSTPPPANYVEKVMERRLWLKTGSMRAAAAALATLVSTIFLSQAIATGPDDWNPTSEVETADDRMASLGTLCPKSWTLAKCEEVIEAGRE